MARRGNHKGRHFANVVGVTILEQSIKLRPVALKFRAFVEDFAEGVLNFDDACTNANFATQPILNLGCSRQVIGMDMGFNDPFHRQAL